VHQYGTLFSSVKSPSGVGFADNATALETSVALLQEADSSPLRCSPLATAQIQISPRIVNR